MACKQMISKLGLSNCTVNTGSIEKVNLPKETIIVTKHAFKVNDLISLLHGKEWGGILMLKGLHEVESELEGIKERLNIQVISLEQKKNSFYDGKALVEITR